MANENTHQPDTRNAPEQASANDLLPIVYESLRRLAQSRMRFETPSHTLQATALVHEVYLRLMRNGDVKWNDPGHFFGAAAEAMRRILVERARRYSRLKHGAGLARVPLNEGAIAVSTNFSEILTLDKHLDQLEDIHPRKARVVKLRYFVGLSIAETAELVGVSVATVKTDWAYARAWLKKRMSKTSVV